MHDSQLVRRTYTPSTAPHFQDIDITRANLLSGELVRRFDTLAYPQVGVRYDGTDSDGHAFPPPARSVTA